MDGGCEVVEVFCGYTCNLPNSADQEFLRALGMWKCNKRLAHMYGEFFVMILMNTHFSKIHAISFAKQTCNISTALRNRPS